MRPPVTTPATDATAPPGPVGMYAVAEEAPTAETAGGYRICIEVRPSGTTVEKEPLDQAEESGGGMAGQPKDMGRPRMGPMAEGEGQSYPAGLDGFKQALLDAVAIYKENSVGADAQAEFQSGYGGPSETPSGPGGGL